MEAARSSELLVGVYQSTRLTSKNIEPLSVPLWKPQISQCPSWNRIKKNSFCWLLLRPQHLENVFTKTLPSVVNLAVAN